MTQSLHTLRRHSSRALTTVDDLLSLPTAIHSSILSEFKWHVVKKDYDAWIEEYVEEFEDPPHFTYETMRYSDLAHPALPDMLSNEASEFRYQKITGFKTLHVFFAFGSPTVGSIFDTEGNTLFRIGDSGVRAALGRRFDDGELLAIHALVFWARDGQTVGDLREKIERSDRDGVDSLFP